MRDDILVSVIVPTYNHEAFIEQCLQSILAQKTNFRIEILVGDDCSTDHTREKIIDISDKNPGKFKLLLHEKNLGPKEYPGRNNAISLKLAAEGKYVAYCEGDDYWIDEYKLQKQVDFMEANPDVSLCFGSAYGLRQDGSRYVMYPSDKKMIRFTVQDMVSYNHVITLTVMHRNGLYAKNHGREYMISPLGDWVFWTYMALSGDIVFMNEMFACYLEHGGGVYSGISAIHRIDKTIQSRLLLNDLTGGIYKERIYKDIYKDLFDSYRKYSSDASIKEQLKLRLLRFSVYSSYIRKKCAEDFIFPFIRSRIRIAK